MSRLVWLGFPMAFSGRFIFGDEVVRPFGCIGWRLKGKADPEDHWLFVPEGAEFMEVRHPPE